MNDIQLFAFVILPIAIMIGGALVAYLSGGSNKRTIGH